MSKMTLEQVKELLKHIQENPESLKQLEELAKAAQKDPHAQPTFSEKILKPSDKDSVVLNPNIKKPLKNAEDSKSVEMEMSPQDHKKKRVGELAKRIKACIEKMQMDKMSKESMDKDDKPHAPGTLEDKAHDVAEEGESVKEAIHDLKDKSADSKEEMLSHLRSLKDKSRLRSPENREAGKESHEKAELEKDAHGIPGKNRPLHSKGINETVSVSAPKHKGDASEKSLAGLKVRRKDVSRAKEAHKEILQEMKDQPKANLPKAELEKQLMSPPFSMTEKSEGYYRDLVKRCWEGYEPTPGKKAYSKGSCRPVKKQQVEPAPTTKITPPVIPSGSGNGGSKPKKPFKKPLMNSEKTEHYKNLVKSTLEKAKIIAGPGRSEKLGTVLGQMNTEDYTSKDNVKDQKSVRLFYESKNNPTKENISAFHESQKIKLPVKETDKKVGQLAEGVENRYFSRKQGKKKSIKDKKPFVSPKKVKTKNTFLEENKNPETLGKTQKVLVGGRVIYTDRSPQGPHQVLAYSIKDRAKSRKKRKPKKTQVRKSEQYYQDLIKKILDN